jgi:hypothetical protein
MPTYRVENQHGEWLTDLRLSPPSWKPGDRIFRGPDMLEIIDVREPEESDEPTGGTLVVAASGPNSD